MPTPAGKTSPSEPKDTQEGATSKQPLETKQPDSRPPSQHVRESTSQSTSQNVPQPTSEPTRGSVPHFGPQTTAESTPTPLKHSPNRQSHLPFMFTKVGKRVTPDNPSSFEFNSYRNGEAEPAHPTLLMLAGMDLFQRRRKHATYPRIAGRVIRSECKCISKSKYVSQKRARSWRESGLCCSVAGCAD